MTANRRDVFEAVERLTDAAATETTTEDRLAASLEADPETVGDHVTGLVECGLVRRCPSGRIRVTSIGEAVADLDAETVVVVSSGGDQE